MSTQYFESLVKASLITELGLQPLTMQNAVYSHSSVLSWWSNTFLQVVLQSEYLRGHRGLGSYVLIEIVCPQQGQSLSFSYVFSPTERSNPHSSFY